MRKQFLLPATLLLSLVVVFQSCSKQSINQTVAPINSDVISVTIAPNGIYRLPLDNSGTIGISMQASHFQVSRTEADTKSGLLVYKYIPATDYRGTDEVVLSNTKTIVNTGSGCPEHPVSDAGVAASSTSYTTVKLNITE